MPKGLDDAALAAALADGWGLRVRASTYLPVGFGAYHWRVTDHDGRCWFVTVDDLAVDPEPADAVCAALGRALATAVALHRDAGLEFVVAPVPGLAGEPLRRLDARYAISVFPAVDGAAGRFGPHRPQDVPEVLELLARLHAATPAVAGTVDRADLAVPGRGGLDAALRDLDRPWTGGPFAEPTRRLLADRAAPVAGLLAEVDRLVARVTAAGADRVVTHGEPHPGNLMRTTAGLRLVDWDTVRLGPPERDLWFLADDGGAEALAGYTAATGRPVDPDALALYRLRWTVADIAAFVADFRRPHGDGQDSTAAFGFLRGYLT
ncbi:aminoglycoside phosphotransferase family protein [Micromonospora sp. PLK6-60]|uniref:aminoglycoside phosphotransferase family protein n=1 Tax=Micromonospora sp. PLK6-60 TaxID=2873383 RepID=UPI001CA76EB0|nr:aminoglycoside phosphotransferase family protein [Micromonospora sp. PLK6-60]MBY8870326.1 aminoglycoside phosphotransferase family protein [Micromonospora sp. PLK6-60]